MWMGLFKKKKKKKGVLPFDAVVGTRVTLERKIPNQGKRRITWEKKRVKKQEKWIIVENKPTKKSKSKKKRRKK